MLSAAFVVVVNENSPDIFRAFSNFASMIQSLERKLQQQLNQPPAPFKSVDLHTSV